MSTWTVEDVTNGLCELEDLGETRPVEATLPTAVPSGEFDPQVSVADAMELHFRKELHRLGPEEFYKLHPTYTHRVLLKRVAPAIPQPPSSPVSTSRSYPPTLVDQALEHLMTTGEFPPHMRHNRWLPAANDGTNLVTLTSEAPDDDSYRQ